MKISKCLVHTYLYQMYKNNNYRNIVAIRSINGRFSRFRRTSFVPSVLGEISGEKNNVLYYKIKI